MMQRLILILAICTAAVHAKDPKPTARATEADAEPKWTILCAVFSGQDHAAQARAAKDYVSKLSGLRGFYLIQSADRTELNFGQYPDLDERAKTDRETLARLTNAANNDKVFRAVLLQPLDGDDPVAPKEWDLKQAKGYWSLQIASFRDDPKRKQAAVDLVNKYRKDGFEAFYHHGPLISSVCIGAYPINAVNCEEVVIMRDPLTGQEVRRVKDPNAVEASDPDEVIVVIPAHIPIPDGPMMTPDGKRVKMVQHKQDIVDPRLLALKRQFPHHADNDQIGKVVKGQQILSSSFLVVVPGQKELRQAQAAAGATGDRNRQANNAAYIDGPNGRIAVPANNSAAATPTPNPPAVAHTPEESPARPSAAPPKTIKAPTKKPTGGKLKSIDD